MEWCWMWLSAKRAFVRVRLSDGQILMWPFTGVNHG